jgi:hypothetical protein
VGPTSGGAYEELILASLLDLSTFTSYFILHTSQINILASDI